MKNLHPLKTLCLQSARHALQWRLPVLYWLAMLPPLALLVVPAFVVLDAQLSHSMHAAALAQQLDLSAITDLLAAGQRHALAGQVALAAALGMTALLSPLLAGVTVTAARSAMTLSFGALLAGGVAEYPRMLRMLLWSGVVMGASLAAGSFLTELAQPQDALLPSDGGIVSGVAWAVATLLAWLGMASIDAGRAVLAADRRRSSAVRAWCHGLVLLYRQPVMALGSYAVLGAIGFGAAGLLGLARLHAPAGAPAGDMAGMLLTQAGVLLLAWFRCVRLFALVAVARH